MSATSIQKSNKIPKTQQNNVTNALTNEALLREFEQIKALIPTHDFHHLNDRQCLVTIHATQFRSLKLKIDIINDGQNSNYPNMKNDSLIIELSSVHLCPALLKQLKKGIAKLVSQNETKPRIYLIVKSLHDIIHKNLLTFAFSEVRKIKKIFAKKNKKSNKFELKVHETKGLIDCRIRDNGYHSRLVLTVPCLYPLSPVTFEIKHSAFPERYTQIYTAQCSNICHKLAKGFDIKYILNNHRRIKPKTEDTANESKQSAFNSETALDIRKDLKTMHKMSLFHNELFAKSKNVRRKVRQMNRAVRAEEEKESDLRKAKERKCFDPNQSVSEALPSLLVCVQFLVSEFTDLSASVCQICDTFVFPQTSHGGSKLLCEYEKKPNKFVNKGVYPQRCHCGCWAHHKCLQMYLESPPFGKGLKQCKKCKLELKHSLFESDVTVLERRWAVKQAKLRELDDVEQFVSDMFD